MSLVSIGKNITGPSETVVYTVPNGYVAIWNLMYVHNTTGSTQSLTVDWYDASTDTHVAILQSRSFSSKEYFQFSGQGSGVVLMEGDEVHMTPASGATFGVICTFDLQRAINNGN
jgi:hypothetical protein